MIVPRTYSPVKTVFVVKGSSLERTWKFILAATLMAVLVTWVERHYHLEEYTLTTVPFTLIGVALSIFLGFRTSAAYDRWWEGRKLWGGIVNITRSFARQLDTFVVEADPASPHAAEAPAAGELVRDLTVRTIAWTHALRIHLRPGDSWDRGLHETLSRYLPDDEVAALRESSNPPIAILHEMGRRLRTARLAAQVTDYQAILLEESLREMTALQGGAERIRNTPVPWGYTVLLHRLVFFYCFALPFGLVKDVGWSTPIVVLLVSQALFGLDEIIIDIQEPFDDGPNSLPLKSLATTIEINLRESLGEPPEERPAPIAAVDGVLV